MNDIKNFTDLASKNNLNIDPATIEINDSGLDFLVAYANEQSKNKTWVLRIPRRDDVIETAEKEGKFLKAVSPYLPFDIPDWQINTSKLIAYPKLSGEPAGTIDKEIRDYVWIIDPKNISDNFIRSFANVLANLHKIDYSVVSNTGIKMNSMADIRSSLADKIEQAKTVLKIPESLLNKWQIWLSDDSYWSKNSALIHGDLHPGHMLINEQEEVTGILDWTEAEINDPALDFSVFYTIFGETESKKLIKYYGEYGGYVWDRMLEHLKHVSETHPVNFATYAIKTGEYTYLDVAQSMLDSHQ